jgi:hypothetical protein
MGHSQSSPCEGPTRLETEEHEFEPPAPDVRKLLLETLPVFIRAATRLVQPGPDFLDNPFHEFLVHLSTASCTFVECLELEKLDGREVESFAPQLSQLACFLNGLLNEISIASSPAEVRIKSFSVKQVRFTVP